MRTSEEASGLDPTTPLVLYDGACGFCHGSVRWMLRRESGTLLRFAPLQGSTVAQLRLAGISVPNSMNTLVLIRDSRVFVRTQAVAGAADYLRYPWRGLVLLRFVPWLPDLVYRLVARFRMRLSGARDVCSLPDPEQAARFLP